MALSAAYFSRSPGQWRRAIDEWRSRFSPCGFCPRQCQALRMEGMSGSCHAGSRVRIASFGLHFGEEPSISGRQGSGTIFFSGCPLKCAFCQNHAISQENEGEEYSSEQLAGIYLHLQKQGAHNINLVSPTPYLLHIVDALRMARDKGLVLPLVYNSGGFERRENISLLEGVVDIYMPDLKYGGSAYARALSLRLSGAEGYFAAAFPAIEEMFRQVGPLQIDEQGVALRGTLIRHLVLPAHAHNSLEVLEAMAASTLKGAYLSLMSQYRPVYHAFDHADIARRLDSLEFREVKDRARQLGLSGWFQE